MREVSIRSVFIEADMPMDMPMDTPMDMGMDMPMDAAWTFHGREFSDFGHFHPSASRCRPRLDGHCLDIAWTIDGQRLDIHRETSPIRCSTARCIASVISLWPF